MSKPLALNLDDFSLTKGGPFFRLMIRLGLMRPDFARPAKQAIFLALFTWLPIFLCSLLQGLAFGGSLRLPFLHDFTVHVRFLIAVPLLVIAEGILGARINAAIKHFVASGLVREEDFPRFESALVRASRLRDSILAEFVMAGLVIVGASFGRVEFSGSSSTWQTLVSDAGTTRTWAGWWYVLVGIPFFQFLLLRWLWRLMIWAQLLWRLSRINLQLIPTHPDTAAGLGFLGPAQARYSIVVFALSSVIAAKIGEDILYGGAHLVDYEIVIGGYIALILVMILSPLLIFSPKLLWVKRRGLLDYGALANQYTQAFDRKWIKGENPQGESVLGSSDIQSLADLGNSFEFVRRMKPFPIDRNSIVPILLSAGLPMLPLILTVYPFDQLVLKIVGFLF